MKDGILGALIVIGALAALGGLGSWTVWYFTKDGNPFR